MSAWVNDALRLRAEHERRMEALDSFLAAYEAEHGVITEAEIGWTKPLGERAGAPR